MSDLHLFAARSDGDALFEKLLQSLHDVESSDLSTLVLNGDTFDFRWSELESEQASIDTAIEWLERLMERLPNVAIHFLPGNHDCLTAFVTRLQQWATVREQFFCYEHQLQIGNALFLHGDVANRRMDSHTFQKFRAAWANDHPKGRLARHLYGLADRTKLSSTFHRAYFPPITTIRRVAYHLDRSRPDWRQQTTSVYFGHTHCPIDGEQLDGVRFFNTGSGIRGMGFAPQWFD